MTTTKTKRKLDNEFRNIKYILTSGMRTKLLLSVYNRPKNLDELRKELKKPSATILHGLKELENINLVKKSQKFYELTSNGYLLTTNMIKLIDNWYAITKNKNFWNNHDLGDIPEECLKKAYLLKDAEYINSTTSDLSNAFTKYIQLISNTRQLKMILPIYSEIHLKNIIKLLNEKQIKHLELITTNTILKSIKQNNYFRKSIITNGNVTIISKKELKIFLTIGDNFMSLTLFFKDKHYDDSQILVGKTADSINWAEEAYDNLKIM